MNPTGLGQDGQVRWIEYPFKASTQGIQSSRLLPSFVQDDDFDASRYGFFGELQEGEDPGLEGSLEVRAADCSSVCVRDALWAAGTLRRLATAS